EIPVRLRREVEFAWHTVPAHLDVLGGRPADRHRRMRKVRQVQQSDVALPLDGIELESELLDLRRPQLVRFLNRRRDLAMALGACDFVARRVLLPLQSFELRDQTAPRSFVRRDILERLVYVDPTR